VSKEGKEGRTVKEEGYPSCTLVVVLDLLDCHQLPSVNVQPQVDVTASTAAKQLALNPIDGFRDYLGWGDWEGARFLGLVHPLVVLRVNEVNGERRPLFVLQ